MASIEGPSFWWERKGRAKAAGWDLCTWHYPVVWSWFFSSSHFCSMYIIFCKIFSPLDLTFVRIIESIVSCFSVFSYLVVWFENYREGKKKIIIIHCSLCTIFVDNVLLKGCLFSAPLHWNVFGGHLACFYYSDCKTWDDNFFFLVCYMNNIFFLMFAFFFLGIFILLYL